VDVGWSRGGVRRGTLRAGVEQKQISQSRVMAGHWAYLVGLWAGHNTEFPTLWGEELTSLSCDCWAISCHLEKIETYLTTLDSLVVRNHRTQLQPVVWAEGTNDCSQTCLLLRSLQGSSLPQTAHQTKETQDSKLQADSPPNCLTKRDSILCHTAQHTTLDKTGIVRKSQS
jgi:hypothetical protein